ncbi:MULTISPECIES: recombinase family protein [Bradyrhizobium]|uniref:recombinase family protein n=1 Tax=Bradyrhizobium TaxID=374 RepID=UPI002169F2BE|nr:recombinase family protein [Bradyrhizobium elkanii]MCS3524564.1 DNA invertase Pin-like site-specific DNA recombinase [Bradyrhizobium elkanii]MCS4072219.1 DNA invertase Pin-like site-specific DNA recombinase [Bradyrhizobium elkanii]MCS4078853.1 DNA invertase Pin-like site-specific DNA recombinase [Bradyrhizobium elkanii]MCW2122549.1 DNA invertase Pin-like site-specific DNA recombinase [Bradyrhizobium elkanii]MCW2169296.1 DNA invertase Pin-like site-specific DNA recombinase [Bradyrhizobium el
MANASIVRPRSDPLSPTSAGRAAQYVRMSTDHQRYSTQNQAAAIAVYAAQHDLVIVRTYADEGRSGLRINRREGLIGLLDDVRNDRADFDHVLVYDISRWGRFQDVDESAYYEFICRQAGIKVCYCAEAFDNDGSAVASIVKTLKRVMAAEYSRDLSAKVHAGACRVASLGFKQGGAICYGLQRELVDEDRCSRGILGKGQRKHLQTDRVLVRPGPERELRIVARIFREFVIHRRSLASIARLLNNEQVPNHRGTPWSDGVIRHILDNEIYIGNGVYNRKSFRLRQVKKKNPPELWIRATGLFEPIVDKSIFLRAQELLKERYVKPSDEQLLDKLREALAANGRLSVSIMAATEGMPSAALYAYRFGSLREAFRRVGYVNAERDYDYLDARPQFHAELLRQASALTNHIGTLGAVAAFDPETKVMTIDGRLTISLRIARYYVPRHHAPAWLVHRRSIEPAGLILALRLDEETNREVTDYFLLPLSEMATQRINLTATPRSRFASYRSPTMEHVVRAIMAKVATLPT